MNHRLINDFPIRVDSLPVKSRKYRRG
jgi:hypothetical protein